MTSASIALRPLVLEIMQMAPARKWSEAGIVTQVRTQDPSARAIDVMSAMNYLHGEALVKTDHNRMMQCDTWELTDTGKAFRF